MEEKIQPTIKETPALIMMSAESDAAAVAHPQQQAGRKHSMTKSLSQVSIISSLLNEEEKRFLGGGATKNQSNLYSTPDHHHHQQQQLQQQPMAQKSIPDTPMSLSPELKPLSINTISPEPTILTTKELPKSNVASNLLQEQEKNLLHMPNTPVSVAGTHHQQKTQRFSPILWLGGIQIVLSIVLVALGGLVIARGASLAGCCAGVWTGAIAGLTGAFGIMGGMKKAQTAFLASSLICVASSTLALALTGIGAVRDSNFAQQDEVSSDEKMVFIVKFIQFNHSNNKMNKVCYACNNK